MTSGGAANHYVSGVIASLLHLNIQDKYLDLLIQIYTVSNKNDKILYMHTYIYIYSGELFYLYNVCIYVCMYIY